MKISSPPIFRGGYKHLSLHYSLGHHVLPFIIVMWVLATYELEVLDGLTLLCTLDYGRRNGQYATNLRSSFPAIRHDDCTLLVLRQMGR